MDRPLLWSQEELLADVRATISDESGLTAQRYSDVKVYRSLNHALERMAKFRVPMAYTPADLDGARSIALPGYMDRRIEVQVRPTSDSNDDTPQPWKELQGWDVTPDGDGGLTLEFRHRLVTGALRILWFAPQPVLPLFLPTLASELAADGTTLTTTIPTTFVPRRAGYIKIDDEWMFYAGLSRTGSTGLTLSNLERAQDDTVAAIHALDADIVWGVPMVQDGQRQLLLAHTLVQLHLLFMTDGSVNERDNHSVAVRYWQDEAKRLTMQMPGRRSKLRLSAAAFGEGW